MTKGEALRTLRGFIHTFAIDPHDAGQVFAQVPDEGIDAETFGDYLDGAGYPELALIVYGEAIENAR